MARSDRSVLTLVQSKSRAGVSSGFGFQALYPRVPRLLNELRIAHGEDNNIAKLYPVLVRIDLLALDDFGLAPIEPARGSDLLEIPDDQGMPWVHSHRQFDLHQFELTAVKRIKRVRHPDDPPLDAFKGSS